MWRYFYPRSPCGERQTTSLTAVLTLSFLSTLSLRRATPVLLSFSYSIEDFYPRSPCGERRYSGKRFMLEVDISIHALLAESDGAVVDVIAEVGISIHALLAESDLEGRVSAVEGFLFLSTLSLRRATIYGYEYNRQVVHFYPRSPCGERPKFLMMLQSSIKFLSTLSLRRATPRLSSPLWGQENFYPRSPCGERPSSGTALLA